MPYLNPAAASIANVLVVTPVCAVSALFRSFPHTLSQKKVNPELPVEIKPSNRARKLQEGKLRKLKQKAVLKRQRDDEQRWHLEMRYAAGLLLV